MTHPNITKLRAAHIPSTTYTTTLKKAGQVQANKVIVDKEFRAGEELLSYHITPSPGRPNDYSYINLVASLMGKELVLVGEKAVGCTLNIIATELRARERDFDSPFDNPVLNTIGRGYLVLPSLFDDEDLGYGVDPRQLRDIGDLIASHCYGGGGFITSGPVATAPQLKALGPNFTAYYNSRFRIFPAA